VEGTSLRGADLETVIIYTMELDRLARFYEAGLGVEPFEANSPGHRGRRIGSVYLGFDQVDEVEGEAPGAVRLWFTVDDLAATFDRFVGLGAAVRYGPTRKPWGATLAAVLDPDGNVVGLSQRMPPEEPER
jgi:lactoylglutathione lyase